MTRAHDIVLFGATGFTGRLVAEVLQHRLAGSGLRWALAGRSAERLRAVREAIGAGDAVPTVVVDAQDAAALRRLAADARVVITTVGPYQRHGEALVQACAESGTDYVDLCGEPVWMAEVIPRLEPLARASGARIVFSCGFDSIPFDLGVVVLQHEAVQRFGTPLPRVRSRVTVMKGGFSGGTAASLMATLEAIAEQPARSAVMADPFALTPGFRGPAQPDPGDTAEHDATSGGWTAPFVMAPINTKNVHRTNALRGHPWGTDFRYDERLQFPDDPIGRAKARAMARTARWQQRALGWGPSRALIDRFVLPSPGQGPDAAQREAGRYELLLVGTDDAGHTLRLRARGERDPGYGATSRMISEAALCLLQDVDRAHTPGGVWTAGAAMGLALVRRLATHAGLRFEVEA